MNKTAIKNFAIWARNKLIADIKYRAGLMGITEEGIAKALPQSTRETQFYDIGTSEPYAISGEAVLQRNSLVEIIERKTADTDYKTAYKYVCEEVAYTWFNRLIAVRFMEVNDYLPSHIRVLSSDSGKMEPDLVTNPFDAELALSENEKSQIVRMKQENKLDEVFRFLFIRQCNALNEYLPVLFEETADYTELLLNISAIDKEGVVYHLVNDIPEDDFNIEKGGQVEIIGWLYQYYNTEPKNEAFAKNGKITKEEIPAVTQLFTPDWIVRYMVENSLGRLWVEGHPNDLLKSKWKYYLEEAEQEPEVKAKLEDIHKEYAKLKPEDIHFIDPCMGSGHVLVYAFDVLMQIYESAGYSERDAAKSILEKNLYGLDIDDRAYQMAYFAVMMKARQYNRRILSADTACHVYSIQDSNSINRNQLKYFGLGLNEVEKDDALNQIGGLLDIFRDAKEYGSILNVDNYNWDLLRRFIGGTDVEGQMTLDSVGLPQTQERIRQLIDIGETMAKKYEAVVTNPPYMASSNGSVCLYEYINKHYADSKTDLFSVFIQKAISMTHRNYYTAMITMQVWMFLSGFKKQRKDIVENHSIINMLHLGTRAFEEISGEVVQTVAFVLRSHCRPERYMGSYCKLTDESPSEKKRETFIARRNIYLAAQSEYANVEGEPIAYWISKPMMKMFELPKIKEKYQVSNCIQPGDSELYLRLWMEVSDNKIPNLWRFVSKGGAYRKWYGNISYVIKYGRAGEPMLSHPKTTLRSQELYFQEGLTWNRISMGDVCFRTWSEDKLCTDVGPILYRGNAQLLGFLNTKIANTALSIINPTIHFNTGDIEKLMCVDEENQLCQSKTEESVTISRLDWDSFETSWDFKEHPLSGGETMGRLIADKYKEWEAECDKRFNQLKANEEELNRIFIDIYGLQDELTPEVEDKDVTVRKADLQRDIKSLLSYAVGCMFGRYSLDVDGLAYAGGEWDSSKYSTFIPDADNIIPITDEEYFEDDIVGLLIGWLKKVYGEDTLEQNLDFIAQALGNKGDTSRDIIRNYFVSDFFKDHCQTYSVTGSGKRPIYWLFDSGKQNGFKALIYLHRYNADTIGNLRVDYLHKMQRVYESEIGRMQDMIDHSTNSREVGAATKRKEKLQKQLKECRDYDEKIAHLALARTELDLDDGVKYNYRKVQLGTDGKLYEVLADSTSIMMDEKKFKDFKKN